MTSLLARAPAKLNLALAVGPREPDGMHPICSWMVTVDLYDEITITRLAPGRLSRYAILWHAEARCRSEIDWSITRDLAFRAHAALERHAGRALPVQLKLEKRIPVGGGLGGGSSAAAATLRAVNELFALGLDAAALAAIGAELGSDVSFLVGGGSALVEGRGERLTPVAVPELHAVVVLPGLACPTGAVYARFDAQATPPLRAEAVRALAAAGDARPGALFNDLAAAAIDVAPALADHIGRVSDVAERPALLSGSGSSIFVVCDDALHAEFLAQALEERTGLPALPVRPIAGDALLSPVRHGA